MVDILKTIKNVMDAHGAWLFGGAVAAGLVAHQARKRRSFDADWFSVTCYGCGRSGFSDEMARVTTPDGRPAYRCVRCERPDVFMQAEGDDDMVICEGCGELRKVDEDFTIDNAREDTLDDGSVSCDRCWENHYAYVDMDAGATNACPHCEGAAGFPREFYYQSDRIDMVPCGTCLTQGRCPGCMEIYPGLTRDVTPEDVFFTTGCTRCGYSESDARAARRTARRWADLVDNPAAAKFMAEGGRRYKGMPMKPLDRSDRGQNCDADGCNQPVSKRRKTWGWVIGLCDACDELVDGDRYDAEDDLEICNICGDRTHTDTVEIQVCEKHTASDYGLFYPDHWEGDAEDDHSTGSLHARVRDIIMALREMANNDDPEYTEVYNGWADTIEELLSQRTRSAEDYGVGTVWMADTYDVAQHGKILPMGSVKRFLSSMPTQQNFNVTFVKSNGEVREMDAILTKPYNPDSLTCDVLEITGRGAVFKRFRVDRVIALYRV